MVRAALSRSVPQPGVDTLILVLSDVTEQLWDGGPSASFD
ncbi:hypothetical protein MLGJGCBP_01130 [Rhodococcus sp. T7]|nr:hypothetical protein MLGJGCBP_10127 [Rhodococcus sp. T7]KAF0965704.1 hypothetical protein MLGJGCBP_01130 [Rhodococcus sp. T7]